MPAALLFTGHLIDLPDRPQPRFPPEAEANAAARIAAAVGAMAEPGAVGFASLARGGDILFHEACRAAGLDTVVILPFAPTDFIRTSVAGAKGGRWVERFHALWDATPPELRETLGLPVADDSFAVCNERLLRLARRFGPMRLIALWNGEGGDGPGGSADLVTKVTKARGRVTVIPTASFIPRRKPAGRKRK